MKWKDELIEKLKRIHARQRESVFPAEHCDVRHTCPHCGTEYRGRYCPQCGLKHGTSRFTLTNITYRVLDVMGYEESGNHSIVRTVRDLFWRPGYMIRDYLGGHCVAYYQPFKLLLLLVIIYTLLVHLMGLDPEEANNIAEALGEVTKDNENAEEINEAVKPLYEMIMASMNWLHSHLEYRILFLNLFVVTAMWKVYRHRVPYTWSETFVAQMYICCQFMILAIVQLLLTRRLVDNSFLSFYLVSSWVQYLFIAYDFFQLYDERRFWPALWRYIKVNLWLALQYFLMVVFVVILFIAVAFVRVGIK